MQGGYRRALLAKTDLSWQAHGELCDFMLTVTQSHEAKIQSGYRRALLATSTRTIFRFSNFLKN